MRLHSARSDLFGGTGTNIATIGYGQGLRRLISVFGWRNPWPQPSKQNGCMQIERNLHPRDQELQIARNCRLVLDWCQHRRVGRPNDNMTTTHVKISRIVAEGVDRKTARRVVKTVQNKYGWWKARAGLPRPIGWGG